MQRNEEKQKYDCKSLNESAYICKLLMWLINEKI